MMISRPRYALMLISILILGTVIGSLLPSPTIDEEIPYGPDTTNVFHVKITELNATVADIEIISYLALKYLEIPHMNDIEQYVYHKSIVATCRAANINDPLLFYAIGICESALNPRAIGRYRDGRRSGAYGIHQVKMIAAEAVFETMGWDFSEFKKDDLKKIPTNVRMSGLYLASLIYEHGDLERALSVYNGRIPEASKYSQKILNMRNKLKEEINIKKITTTNIIGN